MRAAVFTHVLPFSSWYSPYIISNQLHCLCCILPLILLTVNGTRNAFDTAANTTRAATATVVNATRAATANVTLDEDDLAGNHTADDGHDHSQDMVNDTVVAATAPKQSGAGSVAAGATVMAAAFMGSALLLLL